MYPHERSLVVRMKGRPFTILGVNSDPVEDYKKAIKEQELTWPSFWDGGRTGGPIARQWGVSGWPTIFLLDAKGVVRYRNVRGEELDEAIDILVKEAEAEQTGA